MPKLIVHNCTKETEDALRRIMEENVGALRRAQEGDPCHADSLGWLDPQKWAGEKLLGRLEELAAQIRAAADVFVLIGVGGSDNAARSVIEALREEGSGGNDSGRQEPSDREFRPGASEDPQSAPEILYAGNTLSAYEIARVMRRLEGKRVVIDCVAKNFETLEPGSTFRILRQYLEKTCPEEAAARILATGTKGSLLEKLCIENRYTFLEFPEDIGGRYSALSSVGLLPMAVAGVDIRAVVRGAQDMRALLRAQGPRENPAYRYACLRNLYYRQGRRIEVLSCFEPRLRWFYKWWIQLFAESEGKEGKGILPMACEFSEELHSVGQFLQEGPPVFFETFLDVKDPGASWIVPREDKEDGFGYLSGKDFRDINRAALDATVRAHSQRFPCMTLEVETLDARRFGEMFYYFEFACVISCYIMGVNPFDQPGVEAYKRRMFQTLGRKSNFEPADGIS